MDVKAGYKQTEVGVIPNDWEVIELSKICRLICDGTHFTPRYVPQGVPFYSVENVTADNFTNTKFITKAAHDLLIKRCKPEKGDILLTRIGSLGDTKLIDWEVNASIYVSLALLKLNSLTTSEYVYRYSQSIMFVREVEKRSLLNAIPKKINMGDIGKVLLPLPPLPEQRVIAATLSDTDVLIGKLDYLITKKRDIKQAAMQELLTGKRRLSGFSDKWGMKLLGDIAQIKTGKKNGDERVEDGQYPFFVRSQTVERINTFSFNGEAILVPGEGGIGSIFHYINGKFDYHQRVYKISNFQPEMHGKFVYYCMAQLFNKQAMRNSVKATVDSLRLPTFQSFEFMAPSMEEQSAIAAILSDMDAELAALKQKRDKMRALKQGMMQELLTGRTRLV